VCRLLKEFGPFDESMVRAYVQDVVCGVAHLHELGIAHRDLKCANLLLAADERGGVKIADFGTAKRAVEEELAEGVIAEEEDEDKPMETARCVGLAGYDDGRASTSY
jgi:serine/threonine protein kinase